LRLLFIKLAAKLQVYDRTHSRTWAVFLSNSSLRETLNRNAFAFVSHLICANVVTEEINLSQQPRRHHYAASVAVRILIIFLAVDLNIDHLERVNLPLFLEIPGWWRRKPTESLKNIFVDQDTISVTGRPILLHPLIINLGLGFLPHSFWRCTVQGTILDDNVVVAFPDFAGFFVVEGLSSGTGVSFCDLFKVFMLDPLIGDIESSCEGWVGP
jgi:hypothetical protein